jgi:hypothetical protein
MAQFSEAALRGVFSGHQAESEALQQRDPQLRDFRAPAPASSSGYPSYGARKPYMVAASLDELTGPIEGTVSLPKHLDWSGDATYALDRPARLASMYRTVLNEAGSTDDLTKWLNGRVLAELWPTLWLPPKVRQLWESRFPQLAGLRTQAA